MKKKHLRLETGEAKIELAEGSFQGKHKQVAASSLRSLEDYNFVRVLAELNYPKALRPTHSAAMVVTGNLVNSSCAVFHNNILVVGISYSKSIVNLNL